MSSESFSPSAAARSIRALPSAAPFAFPARAESAETSEGTGTGRGAGPAWSGGKGGIRAGTTPTGAPRRSVSRTAMAISPLSWASFTRMRFGPLRSVTSTAAWSSLAGW